MKQIEKEDGQKAWVFEEHERDSLVKFDKELLIVNAKTYILDRMIDGISTALVHDTVKGILVKTEGTETSEGIPGIAVEQLGELRYELLVQHFALWDMVKNMGLPRGISYNFNHETKEFYEDNC